MNLFKSLFQKPQPPIFVVELQKLQFQPGDILLVSRKLHWDREHLDAFQELLQRVIDNQDVKVIVGNDYESEILLLRQQADNKGDNSGDGDSSPKP